MRCVKCGAENPHGRVLCQRCGTRLRAVGKGVAVEPESGERLRERLRADLIRLAAVTAVVVCVALLLGAMLR